MTIDYDFHNPDNLTPTQVGDGYRLLLKSEIKKRSFSREIQKWDRIENKWWQTSFQGSNIDSTYRVPLATWPLPKPDPYAELKAAQAAGKTIQYNCGDNENGPEWEDAPHPTYEGALKDYCIKPEEPEWTLGNSVNGFTLNEGQQWHRLDWTREMLPEGWRPLIIGETPQDNDDYFTGIVWRVRSTGYDAISFGRGWLHHRTRRPLPTPAPNYVCPPVKHPEAKELQERFTEPAWIPWHGGECPLKDDEVEEWEYQFRSGRVKIVKDRPSSFLWTQEEWSADIVAYRVLKWKKSPVKEPAPTDNDTWNSILATNAQLNTKVAELEKDSNFWKSRYETAINAASFIQDEKESLGLLLGQDTITDGIPALRRQRDELQAKLTAAEARLKQLEWVPFSERKPTRDDADSEGSVPVCSPKDNLVDWQPWDDSPRTRITHWRPFAPPAPIDTDRVEFEEWWKSHRHTYTTTGKEAVYEIWKAARAKEVKP